MVDAKYGIAIGAVLLFVALGGAIGATVLATSDGGCEPTSTQIGDINSTGEVTVRGTVGEVNDSQAAFTLDDGSGMAIVETSSESVSALNSLSSGDCVTVEGIVRRVFRENDNASVVISEATW